MKRIQVAHPNLNGNEKKYVDDCMDSSWISSGGSYISKFENAFGEYCGTRHAASCSNGTVALHLALIALGIGPGDEVILPVVTYIATANAVKYVGATPVFVDIDKDTWNMDEDLLEEKITPRTKAILVVHLYGNPANMDAIMRIAKKHGLFVVEDAAESHGAEYSKRKVGSIGDIGTFSFFGNKIITTGEGGMLVTDDEDLYESIMLYKGQGVDPHKRYWHTVCGYNYRMTNIEAAIGLAQLEMIDSHILNRDAIREKYEERLQAIREFVSFQKPADDARAVNWMTSVVFDEKIDISRDEIILYLDSKGIETRPVFYPLVDMPVYKSDERFRIAENISKRGINLPTHELLSDDDLDYICETLVSEVKKHI